MLSLLDERQLEAVLAILTDAREGSASDWLASVQVPSPELGRTGLSSLDPPGRCVARGPGTPRDRSPARAGSSGTRRDVITTT